jgi:hypothetical protein
MKFEMVGNVVRGWKRMRDRDSFDVFGKEIYGWELTRNYDYYEL